MAANGSTRKKMEVNVTTANWNIAPKRITDGFSLEITAKDVVSLKNAAVGIPRDHPVAITFLPGEDLNARVAATKVVRDLGFEPMPHFSATKTICAIGTHRP